MKNQAKTVILLTGLTMLIITFGYLFGGRTGMVIALVLAGGMNIFSYWYSDRIVLSMYKATEALPSDMSNLYRIVEELSAKAQLPTPKIYIIPGKSPNAFATGRNPEHAVVAVTEGLLLIMNEDELKGVLAHELSHIKDHDILISTITATLAGAVMVLASLARWSAIFGGGGSDDEGGLGIISLLLMSIVAPIAAIIIQMGVSRSREYLADSEVAKMAGTPKGLADALEKLGAYSRRIPMTANPSTAHMFIVNPLSGGNLVNLFATHPPLAGRIALLRGERPPSDHPQEDRAKSQAEEVWRRLSA